jgi:hypothetical protein
MPRACPGEAHARLYTPAGVPVLGCPGLAPGVHARLYTVGPVLTLWMPRACPGLAPTRSWRRPWACPHSLDAPGLPRGGSRSPLHRPPASRSWDAPGSPRGGSRLLLPWGRKENGFLPPVATSVSLPGTSPGHPQGREGPPGRHEREPPRDKPGASKERGQIPPCRHEREPHPGQARGIRERGGSLRLGRGERDKPRGKPGASPP